MADSQELRRYVGLLLRWWWLIILCALLGGGAAYATGLRTVPMYRATVKLLAQKGGISSDPTSIYYNERQALPQSQLMTGRPVMQAVIEHLGLSMSPESLADMVKTQLVPEAGLIDLSVTDVDPVRAALIANSVAEAFIAYIQAIQQERYTDYLTSVKGQMDEMAALMDETMVAINTLGLPITDQEQSEVARLQTILAGYRNTYAMLSNNYEQMRLTAAMSADNMIIFEAAQEPRLPLDEHRNRDILLGAATGAMLAVGIAFLIDYLDDTIKTPADVREELGLDTLGAIGQFGDDDDELVVISQPRSPTAEAYRALRTNVRFSSVDRPLRTVLVTSACTSEGKSVTVANLATAMAQAGLRVAAVDADLRRPRLRTLFALEQTGGLTQALLHGNVDGNLCYAQQMSELSVLPSGELPPNPAELLGSRSMQKVLADLKEQTDLVLIDSPPLLPVADGYVLAPSVDGVILVVEAGKTRRSDARRAVENLRQVQANVLGVVLNAVPNRKSGYYYYHHYSYYYDDHYGQDGQQGGRRRKKRGIWAGVRRLVRSRRKPSSDRSGENGLVQDNLDL